MGKIKIFIVTNKRMDNLNMDPYEYIYVGNKSICPEGALRDDIGENISDLNSRYNELTAIYWVYKHIDEYKDYDYIGFEQYRRMLAYQGLNKNCFVRKKIINDLIKIDQNTLNSYFKFFDLVTPRPSNVKSVYRQYSKAHNSYDLPKLLEIIKEKYGEYYAAANEYFSGSKNYLYNSFVFKKEDFIKYCEFIFPLIKDFESVAEDLPERYYFTERLTGLYIYYLLKKKDIYSLKVPVLYVKNYTLKVAIDISKDLLKNSKNRGLYYKLKPVIIYFLPNFYEQHLRRRIAR